MNRSNRNELARDVNYMRVLIPDARAWLLLIKF